VWDPIESLSEAIGQAGGRYHRLVILVGRHGDGKTAILRDMARKDGFPLLNVSLELSGSLIELPRVQRPRMVVRLFKDQLARIPGEVVLLDNLEVLFDPDLALDPLRLLRATSRDRTILAAWSGAYRDGMLTCAEPGHPEFLPPRKVDALVLKAGESIEFN
jgi:hypothetical protein